MQQPTYNDGMGMHVISNSVPTPEQMGEFLGLRSERVAAVRSIMSTPDKTKGSGRSSGAFQTVRKKSSRFAYKAAKKASAKK
jgi:hypothetical protein